MAHFSITERKNGDIIILDLSGKVIVDKGCPEAHTGQGCTELHKIIRQLLETGEEKILLNFAGISHIDSGCLGELVGSLVSVKKRKGEIKLLNLSKNVLELLEWTKLSTVFDYYDDETEALKSFQNPSSKSAYVSTLVR